MTPRLPRLVRSMTAATIALVVGLSVAVAAETRAATHTATGDTAFVTAMIDVASLTSFLTMATSPNHDRWYDWTTDLCSAPLIGSTGVTFDFRAACRRHDFAYRNLPLIDHRYRTHAWNHDSRLDADRRFLADMRSNCSGRSWWQRPTCYAWAQTFYAVVRALGGP